MIIILLTMGINYSWLVVEPYPSEKYDFVNWDDYSQEIGKINDVPNHQPDRYNPHKP